MYRRRVMKREQKRSGNTSVLPLLYLLTVTSYVGMIQIRYTGPDGISQISARFRRLPGNYFLFTLRFYYTTGKRGCQDGFCRPALLSVASLLFTRT